MDLEIEGRHALFFDDDATAAFVNSRDALVPCNYDASLLIDRYDVRHLLDRTPPRPTAGTRRQRLLDDACDAVSLAEIDCERYKDLPASDEEGDDCDSEIQEQLNAAGSSAYQAVPFSYGDKNTVESLDNAEYSSGFRPPFEVPESLLSHLPPTEKLHQIIARTAIFVNAHGRQSEIVLRVKQGDNPTFAFLMPDHYLHIYFQYLIDYPQIVKSNTYSPKREEDKPNNHCFESGALSLLGSVYGTGDDDESILIKEIKEIEPLNLASAPGDSEHGEPSIVLGNEESSKHPFSTDVKEKSSSAMKKISGNFTTIAGSGKEGNDFGHSFSAEKAQNSQKDTSSLKPSILEPPSLLKKTIEKIVEFIVRNGKQFEAILADQDKNIGRFPFLLSTNQYHSYYLKILEEAHEWKLQGKNLFDQKIEEEHHGGSKKKFESHAKDASINTAGLAELSERGHCDPQKDKFKMILGGQKKDLPDQHPKTTKHSGLSADEAAAIVLAATKGESPANSLHRKSAGDGIPQPSKTSGASTEEAAAIVMFATRGWSHANARASLSRDDARTSSLSSLQESKPVSRLSGSTAVSGDVTVATVIAKKAALVASREADSSEAGLTKEQKLKAERLKRAKMFAALIKTGGNCAGELGISASNCDGSMEPPNRGSAQFGTDSDTLGREREGSSAPFATEGSDREHESRKKRRAHHDDSVEDAKPNRKKHHSSRHKQHSSTDDEHQESRHGKSSEHRRRRRHRAHHPSFSNEDVELYEKRRHQAHHPSSDDEDVELNGRRRRKHHSRSERRRDIEVGDAGKSMENSKSSSASMPRDASVSDDRKPSDAMEIPNDLRTKIRAMLLETL